MDGENRRSREAVRNSIRTYGVKVMDPASLPLKKTRERESQESVSRFSEKSLHREYRKQKGWLNRIPYATLVATIICLLGVLIFGISAQRAVVLTKNMFEEVFQRTESRLDDMGVSFIVFEAVTAIVVVMILILGILTTGDTRSQVFGGRRARAGGWVLCIIFMVATIVLFCYWLFVFGLACTLVMFVFTSANECDLQMAEGSGKVCLHLTILNAFFAKSGTDFTLCDSSLIKKFCKDYLEKVSHTHFTMVFSSVLIIFGLLMLLTCLAANYTRIRAQGKLQELEELRHLDGNHQDSTGRF